MPCKTIEALPAWQDLKRHAAGMLRPDNHLRHLLATEGRLDGCSRRGGGVFFDFSRQRVTTESIGLLCRLAAAREVRHRFDAMTTGQTVNPTEKRAALHTATRAFEEARCWTDGRDVMPDLRAVREQVSAFVQGVHGGEIRGMTGKRFKDVVVVGIGGSYLGTEFVACALAACADRGIRLHFLSNVDIHNFGAVAGAIDPEATLWVVISKSYTTAETMANAAQAAAFMQARGLDFARHLVTVTSKGSPGDDADSRRLAAFHMFDFIGGRYSVTSAVGGVPLSLYFGNERFGEFLEGAAEMDRHAAGAPCEENLPLIAALINVWNYYFLGYQAHAIIPYAAPLAKLAPHVQQLYMESIGKNVDAAGAPLSPPPGFIVFGEPGTNAQHSFFQLAHQGRAFPIDFIGIVTPQYPDFDARSKGVTNHQELWANLISQPAALAYGRPDPERPERSFDGNRPSSTLLLQSLSPKNIGRLLAFYEAKTVYEAFLLGINPFDQFGVELGKTLADRARKEMASRNADPLYVFGQVDAIDRFYLETLFKGRF